MIKLTTKKYSDYYLVRAGERGVGYMVSKRTDGWHVMTEVTGEPAFWVSVHRTKRQAMAAIIDHNN